MDSFGKPEVVHTERLPVPRLGKHDILVQVTSAGVGTWDPSLVRGTFQDVEVRFPRVLGSDGAGTVVAIGAGVKRFAVGDRVYGWGFGNKKGGFFAEYSAIDENHVARIPPGLSFDEAGSLAVSGITALQGLDKLGLESGQNVMIFGASGGVGHIAVQLAKHLGLHVFAIASKDDGVDLVRRLGADFAVDGHSKTLVSELRDCAGDGFDGAIVFGGGHGWKRELAFVRRGAIVAYPNGVEPEPVVPRGVKRISYDGESSVEAFTRLGDLIARGPLFHVEVSKLYPLDATAQALRDVQRHHVGKIAIKVES
jgi:NADPH:quinone reductase-like Zn-dependent oxidoreductase